jgi:hypothetical protein
LAETINMTDTLATFADQVTTVAREVGVEGRLGGGQCAGAAGTWKDLTGNEPAGREFTTCAPSPKSPRRSPRAT